MINVAPPTNESETVRLGLGAIVLSAFRMEILAGVTGTDMARPDFRLAMSGALGRAARDRHFVGGDSTRAINAAWEMIGRVVAEYDPGALPGTGLVPWLERTWDAAAPPRTDDRQLGPETVLSILTSAANHAYYCALLVQTPEMIAGWRRRRASDCSIIETAPTVNAALTHLAAALADQEYPPVANDEILIAYDRHLNMLHQRGPDVDIVAIRRAMGACRTEVQRLQQHMRGQGWAGGAVQR